MPPAAPTSAFARVAHIAADRRVHAAFQWLHLQQPQILRWQAEVVSIPAPTFEERARAERLCDLFRDTGLSDVGIDEIGNVVGVCRAAQPAEDAVLVSAHLDTVFPATVAIEPTLEGTRLEAPGACDNGAGLACLLALAAALQQAALAPECDIYFVANVGEEGEGNLRGIRHIYHRAPWKDRITAHLVIDGAGHEIAVTDALGSQRFLVRITGPGGHSWTDASRPNPIVVLSQAIARITALELPTSPRTTLNIGTIEGGTSVNTIPESASIRIDTRSTAPEQLIRLEVEIHRAFEDVVFAANQPQIHRARKHAPLTLAIEKIGNRPAGQLRQDSALYDNLLAVDRHLGIRTETRTASTDANIPLALGVPAVTLGGGGDGGGIHTRAEWYDAHGREIGLRRVLLLLLAMSGI
ncbi:M20/M25/M40 family metallo-hydrolase [Silvibacterium sp.]|uniref:M20/M25/M40 family metallo-hydrolase n=1 Tax=Silvibacterium sp. TaxID=1964179 RepID=UPI0039E38D03